MSLRVEYHELVDLDLLNARNWYEDRERGLGDRLLAMAVLHQGRHPDFGDNRQP